MSGAGSGGSVRLTGGVVVYTPSPSSASAHRVRAVCRGRPMAQLAVSRLERGSTCFRFAFNVCNPASGFENEVCFTSVHVTLSSFFGESQACVLSSMVPRPMGGTNPRWAVCPGLLRAGKSTPLTARTGPWSGSDCSPFHILLLFV